MDTKQAEKPGADDYEERAAIMQYDGELSREEAEKMTMPPGRDGGDIGD